MQLRKLYTLVFMQREVEVLLGWKKRGFGAGKWNGFGGKVESGESVLAGAVREVCEESELRVRESSLTNVGHLEFTFEGDPLLMEVRVYTTTEFEGTPTETEEMRPRWFRTDEIPFDNMWPDDSIWFPYMLERRLFFGKFHYRGFDQIIKYSIEELESMEKFYSER